MKRFTLLLFCCSCTLLAAQNYQADYIHGLKLMEKEKYNDAIAVFSSVISKNKTFDDAYLKRGVCYYLLQDDAQAISNFDQALKINKTNAAALYNRGLIFKEKGAYKKAISDFSKALEIEPDLKYAWFNRALVKLRLSDFQSACLDLAKAADLGVSEAKEIIKYTCR